MVSNPITTFNVQTLGSLFGLHIKLLPLFGQPESKLMFMPTFLLCTGAPVFTVVPRDKTEVIDRTVQFECRVSGVPLPEVTWYREGEALNNSLRISVQDFELSSDSVLSLLNVIGTVAEDGGTYSCVASNEAGQTETSFTLTILCELMDHQLKACKPYYIISGRIS